MSTLSPEDRKKFARDQLQFLKDQGVTNNTRLSRIFKAAGPGQIKPAWSLVEQAKTQVARDLLDCLLTGVQGSQEFGRDRMEDVLNKAGFTVPSTTNDKAFFRMLDGAMEILVPGSYEFTAEELQEIEDGIQRHREKAEYYKKLSKGAPDDEQPETSLYNEAQDTTETNT
jgi:hypothetical protein